LVVHRLTRRLRAQRPTDGLSLTQLSALVTIWRDGPLTAGDLAAREGVKPPSATRVLASLESLGLVSRTSDPTDGRQVRLSATEAGAERVAEDLRARDVWLSQQLAGLTGEERDLLHRAAVVLDSLAAQ
jgi:DNA-binding MarR family transcriptional regulator